MVKIKSLNSKSLAKVYGIAYLIIATIVAPFFLFITSIEDEAFNLTSSIFVTIFFVFFYGIVGAIGGFLISIIYNFIAKNYGGIEIETETV